MKKPPPSQNAYKRLLRYDKKRAYPKGYRIYAGSERGYAEPAPKRKVKNEGL